LGNVTSSLCGGNSDYITLFYVGVSYCKTERKTLLDGEGTEHERRHCGLLVTEHHEIKIDVPKYVVACRSVVK
jgi:hypothetical protein